METKIKSRTPAWGVASLTSPGEYECGDRGVVRVYDEGAVVAAIDALGHGRDAAYAAGVAARTLEQHAPGDPEELLRRCHADLQRTRGAAVSMAVFNWRAGIATWLGVGNVAGALMRADPDVRPRVEQLVVFGGVVGYQMPELYRTVVKVMPGDTLVLATDGVRGEFTKILPAAVDPQPLANRILDAYATRGDDALVLVFRCGDF